MRKEARDYYNRKLLKFPDASKRVFERVIPADKEKIRNIHLSGICGTAMGSLAVLLKHAGYHISGSDTHFYPPMSNLIQKLEIDFKEGFSSSHLKGADVVIIGNICEPDNLEAAEARQKGIPTFSIAEAIEFFFMREKKSIVISGTHGKTTTTGLLAYVLSEAGLDPGYIVGGVSQAKSEDKNNSGIGKGDYFVIEGDEYDTAYFDKSPKFLHYHPQICIITSLEYDHADIYKNMEEYTDAFKFLVREVPNNGFLFVHGDDKNLREITKNASSTVYYYGLKEGNGITGQNIEVTESGQEFDLIFKGKLVGNFFVPLFGNHNILNVLSVCGVCLTIGMSTESIRKALKNFPGMKRRQEVVYNKEIAIIDDFAHHPTAVLETISAIRSKYPRKRLVVFFEPRSVTSRRKMFEEDYGKAFGKADLVFISTPKLRSVDDPKDLIDPSHIVSSINKKGDKAFSFFTADQLLKEAQKHLKKGDVVLIMSNGDFGGIHKKLAKLADNLHM